MIRPKNIIATFVFIGLSVASIAQKTIDKAGQYIDQFKNLAMNEMLFSGVPAAITLAQGILETGGGQSELASKGNNHFGIKCKAEWTGETMLHNDDAANECFRKYPSVEASYRDHSEFLRSRPNYAFLFTLEPTDYVGWANGLRKAGYATNPAYAQILMKIIVDYNLQDYTLTALSQRDNHEKMLFAFKGETIVSENDATAATIIQTNYTTPTVITTPKQVNTVISNTYKAGEVFVINETKVIYAPSGTSLLALANNYSLSYKKLLDFNEMDEVDIISKDQLVFIQRKQKKGSKDFHIVEENEKLHDICQKEGIQLASLLELNRLQKGMEPASGEQLYLKYPSLVSPKLAHNKQATFNNTGGR